jgi:hypothetical protein
MTPHRIVAIPQKVADLVRSIRRSPGYGHPVHAEVATGHGPCRLCLRTFEVGAERRLLFTFDPFHGRETLPLPGPVFIHEEECGRHPEDGGFPEDLRSHPLTLDAYARGGHIEARAQVADGRLEPAVETLFARPEVAYIHVRDTEAGCFDFRIERAG